MERVENTDPTVLVSMSKGNGVVGFGKQFDKPTIPTIPCEKVRYVCPGQYQHIAIEPLKAPYDADAVGKSAADPEGTSSMMARLH